jgi:hypothetical protein
MQGANAADFSILSGSCTAVATVNAGGSCIIVVAFSPASTHGPKTAALTGFAENGTNAITATLTGTALAPALLTVSPALHDFGSVMHGSGSSTWTFTITNTGDRTSDTFHPVIESVNGSQWYVTGSGCLTTLAPGASCDFSVKFAPTAAGAMVGDFIVATGASTSLASAHMVGTGL